MASSSRVNVHSKLTVVSSRPIGPGKTHPITAMDQAMAAHSLHVVFYYRTNPFLDMDLANLRVSLSELLCSYPPVTGRLTRAEEEDGNGNGNGNGSSWFVKCNDAGVRMLRAKVGTTLDEWLRFARGSEERDLTVWEDMPDDPSIWSPFCIQINDFEGGGLAIGVSCTHMHADLTSATLLVKSWTEHHRGETVSHPPLFHRPIPQYSRPPSTNTDTKLTKFYENKYSKALKPPPPPPVKMATVTFRFSNSSMEQCLSDIHVKWPGVTPFDALIALFWTRVLNLKLPQHTHPSLSICIDLRRKLIDHDHPPLIPFGYFGNAVHFSTLSLDSSEALESTGELEHVAGLVHRHVAGLEEEEEELWSSVVSWFDHESKNKGEVAAGEEEEYIQQQPPFERRRTMYGPELTCVSLEHMTGKNTPLMYEAMFRKDEKPVHVSYHVGNVEGEGLIMVMPSPEGGLGRTVMVTLPEEDVAKLCEDQALWDLQPTMLFNGRRDDD